MEAQLTRQKGRNNREKVQNRVGRKPNVQEVMPPPETYKSEVGSLRCARSIPVHTSHYSRL